LQQPHLIIIAGCNGAGKSTYSPMLVDGIIPFDYDKKYLEIYQSLPDSELREKIALNRTTTELNALIETSFLKNQSFCFETNLHNFPYQWIERAKELNFLIDMHFFCLDNIDLAKQRVAIRTKNNGHFVSDDIIKYKWKEGYKNLNLNFSKFDFISFIDNSKDSIPVIMFELEKSSSLNYSFVQLLDELPEYVERRFPDIFKYINS
jgi:predicted ABC-type ATPase